jgi:hypothetical protein
MVAVVSEAIRVELGGGVVHIGPRIFRRLLAIADKSMDLAVTCEIQLGPESQAVTMFIDQCRRLRPDLEYVEGE